MELQAQLGARGRSVAPLALLHGSGECFDIPVLPAGRRTPASLAQLRRRAASWDVVVAHGSKTLPHCALSLLGSRPFIYANIGDPRFWAGTPIRLARVRFFLGRAAAVAAISETARDVLVDYVRISPDKVEVVPNGRQVTRFRPPSAEERARARERFGLPAEGPVVVMLAALSQEKRIDVAIEAVALWPEAHLLIAGAGPLLDSLAARAAERAPGRIRLVGSVADPEAVLAAGDVLLLTSESEGIPGCLIEAGMTGLPVVCTSVGFCGDVVVDGITGRLVAPDDVQATTDALLDAWANRADFGEAARRRCVERYDLAVVTEQWARLIDRVHQG